MSEYNNHHPFKVIVQHYITNKQFFEWTSTNNIIGWSWTWVASEDITYFYFENKDDAVLFRLTFG